MKKMHIRQVRKRIKSAWKIKLSYSCIFEDRINNSKMDCYEDFAVDHNSGSIHPQEIIIMENGLFEDHRYYFTALPFTYNDQGLEVIAYKDYTIGKYRYSDSHVIDTFENSDSEL